MITAVAKADDGTRIILLGVSRGNVTRLTDGQPIRVSAASHPGFPDDVTIMIVFGETESWLVNQMKAVITDDTKIVGVQEPADVLVGATGAYPYGKLDANDEGELRIALATDERHGIIRVIFGKQVGSLGLPSREARGLAKMLIEKADELDQRKS
jgi:hypothetical protein